jgi:hypothetical protein
MSSNDSIDSIDFVEEETESCQMCHTPSTSTQPVLFHDTCPQCQKECGFCNPCINHHLLHCLGEEDIEYDSNCSDCESDGESDGNSDGNSVIDVGV